MPLFPENTKGLTLQDAVQIIERTAERNQIKRTGTAALFQGLKDNKITTEEDERIWYCFLVYGSIC